MVTSCWKMRHLVAAVDAAAEPAKGPRMYEVKSGDTLARIAVRAYGRASRARDIYEANRDKLSSPNAVREGLQIVLP